MACASGMLRLFDSLHTSVQRKSISRWAVKNAVGKKLLHRAPPFNKSPPPPFAHLHGRPGTGRAEQRPLAYRVLQGRIAQASTLRHSHAKCPPEPVPVGLSR